MEPKFWEIIEHLPNTILDELIPLKETQPTKCESEIGMSEKEMLRLIKNCNNLEPVVYSRKNITGINKVQLVISAHGQTEALGDVLPNILGNSYLIPTLSLNITEPNLPSQTNTDNLGPKPIFELAPEIFESDLNLLISLRKGIATCIKHLIVKYISNNHLSKTYRAFITNISDLVVPRSIQDTLDESSWKLAVFEEMNALKNNGSWEIVE